MSDPKFLAGRSAIVTGASRGLGAAIAMAFVDAGASVMLCARDADALAAVGRELRGRAGQGVRVDWSAADVTDEVAIQDLVARTTRDFGGIHILVNNAGVYGPFGPIEEVDWKDWQQAVAINLFGSVVPVRAVLPHFKRQRYGKIIQLSGGGATGPLPRISAYAASKAAVVRFAETLAGECAEFAIDVNSVAPGALNTRLLDEVLEAGADRVGAGFFARAVRQKEDGGASLAAACELVVFLASAASDGITGRLISAVWDDWRAWPGHREDLKTSDAYTLRRITGHDRGFRWGDK